MEELIHSKAMVICKSLWRIRNKDNSNRTTINNRIIIQY